MTYKKDNYNDQKDRKIDKDVSKLSQHLMSNSKWVRLIDAIVGNANDFGKIQLKKSRMIRSENYLSMKTVFLNLIIGKTDLKGIIHLGVGLNIKKLNI